MRGFYYAVLTVALICIAVFTLSPITYTVLGRISERLDATVAEKAEGAEEILKYYNSTKPFLSLTLKDSELIRIEHEIYDVIYAQGKDEKEFLNAKSRLGSTIAHLRRQFTIDFSSLL